VRPPCAAEASNVRHGPGQMSRSFTVEASQRPSGEKAGAMGLSCRKRRGACRHRPMRIVPSALCRSTRVPKRRRRRRWPRIGGSGGGGASRLNRTAAFVGPHFQSLAFAFAGVPEDRWAFARARLARGEIDGTRPAPVTSQQMVRSTNRPRMPPAGPRRRPAGPRPLGAGLEIENARPLCAGPLAAPRANNRAFPESHSAIDVAPRTLSSSGPPSVPTKNTAARAPLTPARGVDGDDR
jgi:hypothetical protein